MTRKEFNQLKLRMIEITRNDDLSIDEQREQLRAFYDAHPGLQELNIEHFLYTHVPLPEIHKLGELTDELIETLAAEAKARKQLRRKLEDEFWARGPHCDRVAVLIYRRLINLVLANGVAVAITRRTALSEGHEREQK